MKIILIALGLVLATPAVADVSFDRPTGTGHVDHHDIYALFGHVDEISFKTQWRRKFNTQCQRGAAERNFVRFRTRTITVDSSEDTHHNPGRTNGWSLDGYGTTTVAGTFCPPNWVRKKGTTPIQLEIVFHRLRVTSEDATRTLLEID